jgi:low affinity Fe/Cu permease
MMKTSKISDWFSTLTRRVSTAAGSWQASFAAFLIVFTWTIGGFYFGFLNELYQLLINSFTTCITFLMVFLIQSAQNRDSRAVQVKLSEIICVLEKADDRLINLEKGTDEDIDDAEKRVASQKTEAQP